eukprot:Gb_18683 [translate_table: standard]
MNRRQELCRNFQRGSCQYGARCKFLHPTQQQQQPNPYGFGVQNQSQSRSGFGFGSNNQNQQKASDNKERGNRFSLLSGASTVGSRQNESQPQVATHMCTDPNICKQLIVEDFKNERPLWKLTCYGHWKYLPCDISGDISYEELRAAAYDDARRGLPLQQIVQRETGLFNSKLAEFDNFLRSPYKNPSNSSSTGFNASSSPFLNSPQGGFQSNAPASALGFGQFGTAGGGGFQTSAGLGTPANPSSFGFGSMSAFGNQVQSSLQSPFGKSAGSPNIFSGQQSLPGQQNINPSVIGVGVSNSSLGAAGPFASQGTSQNLFGSALNTNNPNSQNSVNPLSNSPFSVGATSSVPIYSFGNVQAANVAKDTSFVGTALGTSGQTHTNISSIVPAGSVSPANLLSSTQSGQIDIWLKEAWTVGEIPEDEPPPYALR